MNVVLISASRNPDRQTSQALAALLEGIHSGGGRGEQIFLPRLRIERCRHCEHKGPAPCQTQGRCATQDDFAAVAERIRRADAAVFATPVYFGGGAASLRAFLDRLQKTCAHPVGRDGIAGTPAVAVCIGGGAGHCAARLQATF